MPRMTRKLLSWTFQDFPSTFVHNLPLSIFSKRALSLSHQRVCVCESLKYWQGEGRWYPGLWFSLLVPLSLEGQDGDHQLCNYQAATANPLLEKEIQRDFLPYIFSWIDFLHFKSMFFFLEEPLQSFKWCFSIWTKRNQNINNT